MFGGLRIFFKGTVSCHSDAPLAPFESEKFVTSSPILLQLNMCLHCLSRFKYLTSIFSLVHDKCYIWSILTEEQTSCNLRPVSDVLNFIQRLWLFFSHVIHCWCLHGVALLEPKSM